MTLYIFYWLLDFFRWQSPSFRRPCSTATQIPPPFWTANGGGGGLSHTYPSSRLSLSLSVHITVLYKQVVGYLYCSLLNWWPCPLQLVQLVWTVMKTHYRYWTWQPRTICQFADVIAIMTTHRQVIPPFLLVVVPHNIPPTFELIPPTHINLWRISTLANRTRTQAHTRVYVT